MCESVCEWALVRISIPSLQVPITKLKVIETEKRTSNRQREDKDKSFILILKMMLPCCFNIWVSLENTPLCEHPSG